MHKFKIEVTKFTLVGAANFALTFLVFTSMLKIMGVNYLLSLAAAWVVGMFFSYVLNFVWVFKPELEIQFKARFVRFFLAGLLSVVLNMLALSYLVERTGFDPFYVQIVLIPLVVVFNFATAKFWSLKAGDATTAGVTDTREERFMISKWADSNSRVFTQPPRIYYMVFFAMLVVVAARFWEFMPKLLLGDDMWTYWFYEKATLHGVLTEAPYEKYRPFPAFLLWMAHHIFNFGARTEAYWAVGVLIHAINATLAFVIFRHLSNGRLILSGVLAGLVAVSHFALYQVTQIAGLVEGPSLTFFLIIFLTLLTPSNLNSTTHLVILVGASFLLMHTHERYIGVMPWVCMVILLSPRFREIEFRRRVYIAAGLITIPIYYIGYKLFALDSSFLVGTGGKHISLDYASIFEFTKEALLSLLGINYGSPHLVGINLVHAHEIKYSIPALTAAFAIILILLSGIIVNKKHKNDAVQGKSKLERLWSDKAILIEVLVLGGLVLGPALLTIRFEQRWLVAPYILLLGLIAWSVAYVSPDSRRARAMPWMLGMFVFSTLVLQIAISAYLKNIFFVSAQMPAEVIKRDLGGFIIPESNRLGFFGNKKVCVWILGRGNFVTLYFPEPRPKIECGENVAAFEFEGASAVTKVIGFNRASTQLRDLTEWVKAKKELAADLKKIRYDFIRDFDKGEIAHAKLRRTPRKGGPFVKSSRGQEASLIVRDDFEVKFRNIRVEPNDELRFWLSAATPVQGRIRANVRIYDERSAKAEALYSKVFAAPATDGAESEAQRVSIPLNALKGRTVSVIFAATTVDGEASNKHWVSFERPRIVGSSASETRPLNRDVQNRTTH